MGAAQSSDALSDASSSDGEYEEVGQEEAAGIMARQAAPTEGARGGVQTRGVSQSQARGRPGGFTDMLKRNAKRALQRKVNKVLFGQQPGRPPRYGHGHPGRYGYGRPRPRPRPRPHGCGGYGYGPYAGGYARPHGRKKKRKNRPHGHGHGYGPPPGYPRF